MRLPSRLVVYKVRSSGEKDGLGPAVVPRERLDEVAGSDVPDEHLPIVASRRQELAVRAEPGFAPSALWRPCMSRQAPVRRS